MVTLLLYNISQGDCILNNNVAGAAITATLQLLITKSHPAQAGDFKTDIVKDIKVWSS